MRVVRVRRWILPGAALSLALTATGALVLWEVADAPAGGAPDVVVRAPAQAPARDARRPAGERLAAPAPRPAPARPAPAPTPAGGAPAAAAPLPIEPRRSPVRETPAVRRGAAFLARVVAAPGVRERLDVVEDLARELPPVDAADALVGLLDTELPGDFHEAQTLRLGVLGTLGRLDVPEARIALTERLGATWPRQERLMAIEMLAARQDARPDDLLALAERDRDAQVRTKARWALQRLQ